MMLDAARHVAATDGPEAITARRIAGDIGYSPGTIYQLFDNLDALIVALKSVVLSEILERLDALAMTGKVERDVLALVDAYLAYEREEPALWRTLFDLSLPGGSPFPESFAKQIADGLTRVEVDDADHWILHQQPDAVADAIIDWVMGNDFDIP